jgi:hypothetical protein
MLWFSSMITRILRRPLSVVAAGVPVAPLADALARLVLGVARGPAAE